MVACSPARAVIRMDYLAKLNPDQRAAVEHGVADADARPLLVIAGAGSGKTDTLAHRVAHLVMNGADPHRILLLTFSRRAAAEMERRAERILNRATGTNAARWARLGRHVPRDRRAASCANMPSASGSTARSRSTTARMRPT